MTVFFMKCLQKGKSMRVMISGPTGAIGTALIQKLLKEGHEILAICHKGSPKITKLPQDTNLSILQVDLCELKNLTQKINKKYDVFYHFAWAGTTGAARNDVELQIRNIEYTVDAVEFAKRNGCHIFIGAGSQAEFGRVEGKLHSTTPTHPENGYGMAKLCAGQLSRLRCAQLQMQHIWVRILSVYGPNDGEGSMIMSTITKLLAGKYAKFTPSEQKWDYLYSADAAEAMYLLAQKGQNGKTYILGSGKTETLRVYIDEIYNAIAETGREVGKPGIGELNYADKQVMHLESDNEELFQDTGFVPRISFKEGIRKTVNTII